MDFSDHYFGSWKTLVCYEENVEELTLHIYLKQNLVRCFLTPLVLYVNLLLLY